MNEVTQCDLKREDIIRIAKEAGFDQILATNAGEDVWIDDGFYVEELQRFAALIAAAEREACIALVNQGTGEATSADALKILRMERDRISAAIRARGEQEQPR